MTERRTLGAAAASLLALAAAIALASPDRAGAQAIGGFCSSAPPGTSAVFNFDPENNAQGFLVPADVNRVTITAEGGHGGEIPGAYAGGAGGLVEATFAVTPGECLNVYVGGYGYRAGGEGFAEGGKGGHIPSSKADGNDGAGGGGATAVTRGLNPLLIAGGGGGGGGNGSGWHGGNGGDGGNPARDGTKHRDIGGRGGKAGAEDDNGGGGGQGTSLDRAPWGGGGGGGAGYDGGSGGGKGGDDDEGGGAGGGGGGGGSSQILGTPVGKVHYGTSGRTCVYNRFSAQCHGAVTITWEFATNPALIPLRPQVHVLPFDLTPAVIPIALTPATPPRAQGQPAPSPVVVRLELLHRHKGRWRPAGSLTATATALGSTELEVPVPAKVRRQLRSKKHGRLRIEAFNVATGERIDRDQLRFD